VNVTILGGTGLLGRHLAPRLAGEGHRVTVTGRSVPHQPSPGIDGVAVDLATGDGLTEAIGLADHVVHLASDSADP
jgi:nucleoside-diphosphate-sugar epimerase